MFFSFPFDPFASERCISLLNRTYITLTEEVRLLAISIKKSLNKKEEKGYVGHGKNPKN